MSTDEKIDLMAARLERMEKIWADLLLKRPSRSQQARKAKVSRTTLWRREKRLELELLANGRR